jgi:hypothetical protein
MMMKCVLQSAAEATSGEHQNVSKLSKTGDITNSRQFNLENILNQQEIKPAVHLCLLHLLPLTTE